MSKFFKITLIMLTMILISINIYFVQATDIENTSNNQTTDAASQVSSGLEPLSTSSVTKVSTVNSYDQANLQFNNILSIILISIGVLLILFAIAILIRLKK